MPESPQRALQPELNAQLVRLRGRTAPTLVITAPSFTRAPVFTLHTDIANLATVARTTLQFKGQGPGLVNVLWAERKTTNF